MKITDSMKRRRFRGLWLLAVLFLFALFSLSLGRYPLSLGDVFHTLLHPGEDMRLSNIVLGIRLPRVLLSCMVGMGLSLAGGVYQTVFHSPMASPDLLGASAGAGFGAALGMLLGLPSGVTVLISFLMGLVPVALSALWMGKGRGDPLVSLILAGIVLGALFSGGTSCVKLLADPDQKLPGITYWLMGGLSGAQMGQVLPGCAVMALAAAVIFLLRFRMNALRFSDEEAASLGIRVARLRLVLIFCATLLTAVSVSLTGLIGWVGLMVPNLCLRLWGSDMKGRLPAMMLLGAGYLLLMDNLARTLLTVEIPIGILTAFTGAPLFWLMVFRGKGAKT